MKKKHTLPPRINTALQTGLTAEQAMERKKAGLDNRAKSSTGKSYVRIVTDNLFTYFNFIWALIIGVLVAVGAYGDLAFSAIIIANTALAIFGEVRAKRTVERLSMMTLPRVRVIREGKTIELRAEDMVLDDVVELRAGNQIPADLILLDGAIEVNESLLTGESDGVKKQPGDLLLAGSFVISGGCRARAERVGNDAYIQTVASKAKAFKASQSYLLRDIRKIIRIIGILIIPFAVLTFLNNRVSEALPEALRRTAAALAGMIPAGMFLLITVALSLGVIRLARRKTVIKDPYSIEMLARTNMLCLDKTGTITDGTMRVKEEWIFSPVEGVDISSLMAASLKAQPGDNFTSLALHSFYSGENDLVPSANLPFSSKRKCTATSFEGVGTVAYGAPDFLGVAIDQEVKDRIKEQAGAGRRVLMLAYSPNAMDEDALPEGLRGVGLVILEDHIREEAYDTIRWFKENGVGVKIISGDDPLTVSVIASRVGVEGAERYISLEGLTPEQAAAHADEYAVFGRVSPEQKHALIAALRQKGYVVSMTGDGVNDTMALKEADCSIAMADGSEAARGLSNIVLLDNNFASLPSVVCEGRRVVNNVERSSTLFLMKTFFALSLSLLCIITRISYPFLTTGMLLFEVFVDGIPSVILALQKNDRLIKGRFISGVLKRSLPSGCLLLLSVVAVMLLYRFGFYRSEDEYLTMCVLALTFSGFVALFALCFPFNRIRLGCILFSAVGIALALLILPEYFGITVFNWRVTLSVVVVLVLAYPVLRFLHFLFSLLWKKTARPHV